MTPHLNYCIIYQGQLECRVFVAVSVQTIATTAIDSDDYTLVSFTSLSGTDPEVAEGYGEIIESIIIIILRDLFRISGMLIPQS